MYMNKRLLKLAGSEFMVRVSREQQVFGFREFKVVFYSYILKQP